MSGMSTSLVSDLYAALDVEENKIAKIFEQTVTSNEYFRQLKELTKEHGVELQIFDVPAKEDFLEAKNQRTHMIVDVLHFTSAEQKNLVIAHGLRALNYDESNQIATGFRLRCRDLLFLFWQKAMKTDTTIAKTFPTFLRNVVMANLKAPMTPYDEGGLPYDVSKNTKIDSNSDIYKRWQVLEKLVFTFQLKVLCIIARYYEVSLSLLLTGRGAGAKKGVGGTHIKYLTDAVESLTEAERQQIIHVPDSASQHACLLLPDKAKFGQPTLDECMNTEKLYVEAVQRAGLLQRAAVATSYPFVQQLWDTEVSIHLFMFLQYKHFLNDMYMIHYWNYFFFLFIFNQE